MDSTEILTEKDVYKDYRLTGPWLRKRRRLGDGPTYMKIGRLIRYRRSDIEAYLADRTIKS